MNTPILEQFNRPEDFKAIDILRTIRGPATMFRRGEPLALMPFTFVR